MHNNVGYHELSVYLFLRKIEKIVMCFLNIYELHSQYYVVVGPDRLEKLQ